MWASDVVVCNDATYRFGLEFRTEIVRGTTWEITVRSLRNLRFRKEGKVRYGEDAVFYTMELIDRMSPKVEELDGETLDDFYAGNQMLGLIQQNKEVGKHLGTLLHCIEYAMEIKWRNKNYKGIKGNI